MKKLIDMLKKQKFNIKQEENYKSFYFEKYKIPIRFDYYNKNNCYLYIDNELIMENNYELYELYRTLMDQRGDLIKNLINIVTGKPDNPNLKQFLKKSKYGEIPNLEVYFVNNTDLIEVDPAQLADDDHIDNLKKTRVCVDYKNMKIYILKWRKSEHIQNRTYPYLAREEDISKTDLEELKEKYLFYWLNRDAYFEDDY